MILRINLSATPYELSLVSEQRWFSVTDEQINLTYCNGVFVTVRGFSCEQLIGSPHNIVRHPDMLEVVFARMYSYLKDVESWMEIVKKCCSIGDHYWVNAYVTYIFKQGNFTGYKFGRVKPERNQVSGALGLDARLKNCDGSLQILYLIGAILTSIFPPFIALAVTATALLFGGTTIGLVIAVLSFLAIQALRAHPWHRTLKPIGSIPAGCFDSEQIARPFSGEQSPVARIPAIAIEAARAGEQDRGFTVVGDESGALPPKTQASTESIQCMIHPLKGVVDRASEQQAHVVEESIVSVSDKNTDIVDSSSTVGNDLKHTVQQFNTLVARFNS